MKVKTKNSGEVFDIQWQKYKVGLYVCISKNNVVCDQFGLNKTVKEFIQSIEDDRNLEILNN